jgi:hypothetical protein
MILTYIAVFMAVVGVMWLVYISITSSRSVVSKTLWAVANLIGQPLAGIVFYIVKRQGLVPLLLLVIGWMLLMLGYPSFVRHLAAGIPR